MKQFEGPGDAMHSRRVLLIGYGTTTEAAVRSLLPCVEVIGVVRDTMAPSDPVVQLASRHGVPLLGPTSPNALQRIIAELRPQCAVISSYNRCLGSDLLKMCPFVNVHYAPLPRFRGRAPVTWAIINGEPTAGISIHLVDEAIDSGNLLYQEEITIATDDTATTLYTRLNAIQERHLGDVVLAVLSGSKGRLQESSLATYGCARNPEDGEICWTDSARHIERLVRALTPPFPGAFTYLEGRQLIVHRAVAARDLPSYSGSIPGRVARLSRREGWVDVLAGEGSLRLLEVKRPGEGPVPAATVIRSTKATLGLRTSDLLRQIADLEARVEQLARLAPRITV
jgi:methionyl-tRNA formyltransferase